MFDQAEQRVIAAGVADNQDTRLPGYPYLRVNRFLSDFRREVYGASFDNWTLHMQELALRGMEKELSNLSDRDKKALHDLVQSGERSSVSLAETLRRCGDYLRGRDIDRPWEREYLRAISVVPDSYRSWLRVLGLYPLTALAFRFGIDRWHRETSEIYALPLDKLPVLGRLQRYNPPRPIRADPQTVRQFLANARVDALGVPLLSSVETDLLFEYYAPVFEIDVATDDDQPGQIQLDAQGLPFVDIEKPVVYRHLSHIRLGSKVLLQLNYMIWFASRPAESPFDPLSGDLDGITWRLTLLPDGRPWVFDTIHNCGCYHLFFPTRYARAIDRTTVLDELAFMPQSDLSIVTGHRPVIRIACRTHYIERLTMEAVPSPEGNDYHFDDADKLRSLRVPGGTRKSLYGEDGIIDSSRRGERYFFWPMGIPSPGAMRQWGHHATAFVGRRHFDDPRLFERNFMVVEE